jgi:hypothetical protein
LSAGDARCIEVNWDLIRLQFVVSTIAIREYTWDIVSLNNIKKTFSRESSNSSGDAIGRNNVNPHAMKIVYCKYLWTYILSLTFILPSIFS